MAQCGPENAPLGKTGLAAGDKTRARAASDPGCHPRDRLACGDVAICEENNGRNGDGSYGGKIISGARPRSTRRTPQFEISGGLGEGKP